MKKAKKIFALLIVVALAITMSIAAFAAPATKGSITVNNTVAGKTYDVYKIFDLTYSDGTPKAVAYTIDSDWVAFFNGAGSQYIVDADTDPASLNPIVVNGVTKYINITEANKSQFAQDALEYAAAKTPDASQVAVGDSVVFEGLELGYYLVYPEGAADIKDTYASICSLTSTVPDATVNVKADYPTIDKVVDDSNVEVGQEVTFTITGKVPDTTGYEHYTYIISDTMSSGLLFTEETAGFKVMFGDTDVTADVAPVIENNGFTLTYDMTQYQDYVGQTITITYKAVVTEEAVNSDTTENSATLEYSNDPKDETSTSVTPPVIVKVHSSMITVNKVDANDTNIPLAGAKFVLMNSEGKYYQAMKDGVIITNVASTTGLTDVNWVDSIDDATVLVTGEDGKIEFIGIENGDYSLVEIEAPEGYNKLTSPVNVKVGYNEEGTAIVEKGTNHVEQVKNNSGNELPETGGIGTMLFVIFGGLAVLAAGIFLVTNRRMSKENF